MRPAFTLRLIIKTFESGPANFACVKKTRVVCQKLKDYFRARVEKRIEHLHKEKSRVMRFLIQTFNRTAAENMHLASE